MCTVSYLRVFRWVKGCYVSGPVLGLAGKAMTAVNPALFGALEGGVKHFIDLHVIVPRLTALDKVVAPSNESINLKWRKN